jgi:adenylate kinase family enzyme
MVNGDAGYLPTPSDPGPASNAEHTVPETVQPRGPLILVFGGPGSGKDTQCDRLSQKYGCKHLSAVDLLGHAIKSASTQGAMISTMIRSGQIVPPQVTLDLLKEAISATSGPYVIQGFPTTVESLEAFEAQCGPCAAAILFDVSEEVLTERLLARANTSNRTDDTPNAIQRRLRTFQLQSMPVLDALSARGLVRELDGAVAPEEVFAAACEAYDRVVM